MNGSIMKSEVETAFKRKNYGNKALGPDNHQHQVIQSEDSC